MRLRELAKKSLLAAAVGTAVRIFAADFVIECSSFRLTVAPDCAVRSLVVNGADGGYDLVRWGRIPVGDGSSRVRAFLFEKDGATWVAYWHETGAGTLSVPLDQGEVEVRAAFAVPGERSAVRDGNCVLSAAGMKYARFSESRASVVAAFAAARTEGD